MAQEARAVLREMKRTSLHVRINGLGIQSFTNSKLSNQTNVTITRQRTKTNLDNGRAKSRRREERDGDFGKLERVQLRTCFEARLKSKRDSSVVWTRIEDNSCMTSPLGGAAFTSLLRVMEAPDPVHPVQSLVEVTKLLGTLQENWTLYQKLWCKFNLL